MAVPLVQVRHKKTGVKTFLPESSLRFFPDYVKTPSQKSRDEVPDGTAFPQTAGDQPEGNTTTRHRTHVNSAVEDGKELKASS